jgi:hypothetical protein
MDFKDSGIPDAFRTLVVVPMMLVDDETIRTEVKKQGNNPGEPPEQDGQQNCPERTTPRKAVRYANLSVHRLAHQGGPVEALPLELPDSSPGVIIIYKVGNKNACTHIFSFIHCAVRACGHCEGFYLRESTRKGTV